MIIFLDLDGVIINFAKSVCDWFNIPYQPEKITHWNSLYKLTKTKPENFWDDVRCSNFWEELDFYPDAKCFIERLKQKNKVILLSTPAIGCASYRQNWIEDNLPEFFKKGHYILTPAKWACANKNTILIDDSDRNCKEFSQNNSCALLYPQPWNSNRGLFNSEEEKNNDIIKLFSLLKNIS